MKTQFRNSLALSLFACVLAFIASSCNPAPAKFDLAAAKSEIEAANKTFSELVAKGDSTGVTNMYTDDAKFMGANAPAVVGKTNIKPLLAGLIKAGVSKIELKTLEIWGDAEILTEEGELTIANAAGQVFEKGKYLVVWKKVDGQWKILRDMSSSDTPIPTGK